MKKTPSRKTAERRKKPRSRSSEQVKVTSEMLAHGDAIQQVEASEGCINCSADLKTTDRALFVEEEVGRVFCSEKCIAGYFAPDIERLEKEYFRFLSESDLSAQERENLAHLRFVTLQEPDEIWREKTLTGDFRFTLISEFEPGNRSVWCVCICLFLRGEPSFLYLAFPTKNAAMVNHYRKGERVQWIRQEPQPGIREGLGSEGGGEAPDDEEEAPSDRLAESWTEDETFMAKLTQQRKPNDIPADEFSLYQSCLEETLETPDEVWAVEMGELPTKLYHFIRRYDDEKPGVWYIIVARETDDDEEQIEILDAFPTRDPELVDRYRSGEQEVGQKSKPAPSRVVH